MSPATSSASVQPLAARLLLGADRRVRAFDRPFLRDLAAVAAQEQVEGAPTLSETPAAADRAYAASDGLAYFVPTAVIARRSRATDTPWVFIDRREAGHVLLVQLEIRRHGAVSADAHPLPATNWQVTLSGSGQSIGLTALELPADEGGTDDALVTRLACEAAADPNLLTSILQGDPNAALLVTADVHWRVQVPGEPAAPSAPAGPKRVTLGKRRLATLADSIAQPVSQVSAVHGLRLSAMRDVLAGGISEVAPVIQALAGSTEPRSSRLTLARLPAHFPTAVAANRPIYSRVGGAFGSSPAAAWVHTTHGDFVESPVPDQFYVLPDQYRLAFDVDQGTPEMSVLLIPASAPADPGGQPTTFSRSYGLRVRFSVVPWLDGARIAALRDAIREQTGIPYPDLVLGGIASASFGLSDVFSNLGATLVGTTAGQDPVVDSRGFELVLDCTSEFYNLLARLVVADGLTGDVVLSLSGQDGEAAAQLTVPVILRLDRPDTNFLTTRLEPIDDDNTTPLELTIVNPAPVGVRVGTVRPTLLVTDPELASPLKATAGTATPAAIALPPATTGPTETRLAVSGGEDAGVLWTGVALSLEQISLDLDAQQVLARAQELGSATGLSAAVRLQCYALQHPEVLPPELSGLVGLQIELRRSAGADPITAYLTREAPAIEVQVAFTLSEVLAGASPEQPRFDWRRRNMTAVATGEWSEWETIMGRELFVTPALPTAPGAPT
jgi:hypothetical protein